MNLKECAMECTWPNVRHYSKKLQPSGAVGRHMVVGIKQSNPMTGPDRTWRFQEAEAPRFQDNRHMKVVRLSALRTGRLYPSGNIPGTHVY